MSFATSSEPIPAAALPTAHLGIVLLGQVKRDLNVGAGLVSAHTHNLGRPSGVACSHVERQRWGGDAKRQNTAEAQALESAGLAHAGMLLACSLASKSDTWLTWARTRSTLPTLAHPQT